MSVAARKLDTRTYNGRSSGGGRKAPSGAAARASSSSSPRSRYSVRPSSARALFQVAVVCILMLAFVGFMRVTLTAKAAEAAIDAIRLQGEIKAQRLTTDKLEITKSSLMEPSRLEGIATTSMRMSAPKDVRYIEIGEGARTPVPRKDRVSQRQSEGRFVSAMMNVVYGEAQLLIAGGDGIAP